MRILYFTRDYSPHDQRFLSALAESEHEIYFLRLERLGSGLEDKPLPPGVEQVQASFGFEPAVWHKAPAYVLALKKVIKRIQPDLIHAGPIQRSAFLTAATGFHPLVSMSWGSDMLVDAERSSLWAYATQYALKRSDVLIADCKAVAQKANELGFPRDRIVIFPWGVNVEHFQPDDAAALRKRVGWENEFVLLSLRSWEPLYGVDELLRGFINAARQQPRLRLILLGKGSMASQLREIVFTSGLSDRIHFGGLVSQQDLPMYYQSADLYASASHSDGSSVSLLEAMACGLPVLVSAIPGNLEWITQDENGWLFPVGDEQTICEGILQAYHQKSSLAEMGKKNRRIVEKKADWSINKLKLFDAYQMALNGVK